MCLTDFKKEKFDIILIAGQSNSEGFGIGEATEEYVPDDKILWLNDASHPRTVMKDGVGVLEMDYPSEISISIADEPFGETGSKVGKPALFFAKAYVENGLLAADRKLLVLNAGVGGTGFRGDQWGLGRMLYERAKVFTQTALSLNAENRLVAFLWHQGECDSFENADWGVEKRYATHKQNLGALLADFKREFSCPNLPFIAGGFCDEWYKKYKTPCDAVLRAVREICAENGAFVETAGLKSNNEQTGNGDDIHFCRDASHTLGRKYFEAYKTLL